MNFKDFSLRLGGFFRKKKKVFIPLLALLAAGVFFYWWQFYETPVEKWHLARSSRPEDYLAKEVPEGIKIENEKAGLSFVVPTSWIVKKPAEGIIDSIRFYSPGATEETILIMESGCRIIPDVLDIKTSLATLDEETAKGNLWNKYSLFAEIIKVGGYKTLKRPAASSDLNFYHLEVLVPVKSINPFKNRVFSFVLDSSLAEKDDCSAVFNNFLNTVVIK